MRLNDLALNEKGMITSLKAKKNIKKRLMDIGLVNGSIIEPILFSPGKDMVAYYIKGAVIAIRKDDTLDIEVRKI